MGASEYRKRFAADFRDAGKRAGWTDESAQTFHDMVVERAEEHHREIEEAAKREEPTPFAYIHLRDVNIFLSTDVQPVRVDYWRGRLSAVDGSILGQAQTA